MYSSKQLLEIIDEVKDIPVIVEGKRDRIALTKLGFSSIIELDRALFVVVERFSPGDTVQILTDLDKKGKQLYGRLKNDLSAHGICIDERLRDALFHTQLSHMEGLDSYLARLDDGS